MLKFCKKCNCETERNKSGECKPCKSVMQAKWVSANKDKVRARKAKWQAANRDKGRVASSKWKAANADKIREYQARYVTENAVSLRKYAAEYRYINRDKCRANSLLWSKANPEKRRTYEHNRRSKMAGGKLSPGIAERLLKLQKGKCACCKRPLGDDYHLDHIMPLALGGTNTDDNIQLLRSECNNQKYSKHPIDFMRERGFLL